MSFNCDIEEETTQLSDLGIPLLRWKLKINTISLHLLQWILLSIPVLYLYLQTHKSDFYFPIVQISVKIWFLEYFEEIYFLFKAYQVENPR